MEFFHQLGSLKYVLLLLSLAGTALILERLIFFVKLPKIDQCKAFERINKMLLQNKNEPKTVRDELVLVLLKDEQESFYFGLRVLRLIAIVSPMVGLLGTVIGIIKSFKIISLHEGPVHPALIADGLWVALTTTAAGLCIAIPCTFAAFIFARIAEKRLATYQKALNYASLRIEGVKL